MTAVVRRMVETGEILAKVKSVFVMTGQTKIVEGRVLTQLAAARSQIGFGHSSLTLIESDRRCGVTSSVKRAMTRFGARHLYFKLAGRLTPENFTAQALTSLGDPCAHRQDPFAALTRRRLSNCIAANQLEMLAIDDFHHGLDPKTGSFDPGMTRWLKVFFEELPIPVILMGATGLVGRLDQDPDFASSAGCVLRMKPFDFTSDKLDFFSVLREFETVLNSLMQTPAAISSGSLPKKIHTATGGVVGDIALLIERAVEAALCRPHGPDGLLEEDFNQALTSLPRHGSNPFLPFASKAA